MPKLRGTPLAGQMEQTMQKTVSELNSAGLSVKLAVVLVGNNPASARYVKNKQAAAERVGIECTVHRFDADITQQKLIQAVQDIQVVEELSGLIVQLPLPDHIEAKPVLNSIDPSIDVDGLTDISLGRLFSKNPPLIPPTPAGILRLIESTETELRGKNVLLLGTGMLIGRPMSVLLMNRGAAVLTVNSSSTDLKEKAAMADIIISAVGKQNRLTADVVKPDTLVIDAGIDFDENGKICGDSDVAGLLEKDITVTPTPGGVGPLTVAGLLWNTVECGKRLQK